MSTPAERVKASGNEYFKKGKIDAAIEAYSECIALDPTNAVYRTNRALCHRNKGDSLAVIADCNEAIRLDGLAVKPHYLLGSALVEQRRYAEGLPLLRRALDLCKERTVSYKDDILRALLLARKREWEAEKVERDGALSLTERLVPELLEHHYHDPSTGAGVDACVAEALALLRRREVPAPVPDRYCCQISMEVMLDPLTTPSGITYERASLREHLQKVGAFDPVTRAPLRLEQAVPNIALRETIREDLDEHPWAYESNL